MRAAGVCFLILSVACGGSSPSGPELNPDQDDDGILNAADECPEQPETDNGWSDSDGCPDTTSELYQFARTDGENFWDFEFDRAGFTYDRIDVFSGYTSASNTPCGQAEPNNAFYCPANHGVYYHIPFLDNLTASRGDFASVYVIAHELGHSAQRQLGFEPPLFITIQLELQADCLAGSYTKSADLIGVLEEGDFEEAVLALFSFGDPVGTPWFDRDAHGTPGERIDAFNFGFELGAGHCTSGDFFAFLQTVHTN
jgi:predicted metalloprotease